MTPETATDGSGDSDEGSEVIERLGNGIMVRENGTARFLPRNPKTLLMYEHNVTELFDDSASDSPLTLSDDPSLAVAPTDNELVYVLWNGDDTPPVRNPPSESENVLSAVLDIVEGRGTKAFEDLYARLFATQARPEILNRVLSQYAPIPPASVVPESDGWVIEGTFVLTWHTNTYLVTRDYTQQAYDVGSAESIEGEPQLLQLSPTLPETSVEIPLSDDCGTKQVTLSERELRFLTKASWLVDYRQNHDDDVFWTQIERLVRTESSPF